MLVCGVSLRAPRRAIAADLTEAAAADDASTTGFIIFAALVDDPAAVSDTVDAYIGEIMLEAASASDNIDAGFVASVTVVEAVTATDTPDGTAAGAAVRSAMVMGVFVNSTISRAANANGIMVNL